MRVKSSSLVATATLAARNQAHDGGAAYISKSKLIIESDQTRIYANSAVHNGGGLYLTTSKLKIRGESLYITRNRANSSGGGIHASNSSIIILEGTIYFISNKAENGRGISLEKNANLCGIGENSNIIINFTTNKANQYGGAMYVADEINPDMCAVINTQSTSLSNECFSKSV